MTGQCDFLRKFPNFLRKQGVSAFSVYPPLSLCLPVPFPCPIHHLSTICPISIKPRERSHGYDSPVGSGRKELSS